MQNCQNDYGEGEGTGARILNPVTKIIMEENSVFTLDTAQIKGVDSTKRETEVIMGEKAKLFVVEKLMTHDQQNHQKSDNVYRADILLLFLFTSYRHFFHPMLSRFSSYILFVVHS